MSHSTVTLGSPPVKVLKVGHGLMLMTWKAIPVPDDQAFAAIKAGLDLVSPGEKVLLNSGEFYGFNPKTANLELLGRFFAKYPEYADRAFLSVKGGANLDTMTSDSSPENLRRSVENIIAALGGHKKLDLFECARVDPRVPIEDTITTLAGFIKEGLFTHIGLSEVSAATLRRAAKVHPIAAAEIEVSPWTYEEETRKVIAAAKELDVSVVAYSPMGSGFLTGAVTLKHLDTLDIRNHLPRFQDDAYETNKKFVDALSAISSRIGITNAKLCIAWVGSLGAHVIPLPGSSAVSRTLENFSAADVKLSEEDLEEVEQAIRAHAIQGFRYPPGVPVWG